MATKKQTEQSFVAESAEQPVNMDGAGEFPVIGFEPLFVPEGVTLVDLVARIEALEAAINTANKAK